VVDLFEVMRQRHLFLLVHAEAQQLIDIELAFRVVVGAVLFDPFERVAVLIETLDEILKELLRTITLQSRDLLQLRFHLLQTLLQTDQTVSLTTYGASNPFEVQLVQVEIILGLLDKMVQCREDDSLLFQRAELESHNFSFVVEPEAVDEGSFASSLPDLIVVVFFKVVAIGEFDTFLIVDVLAIGEHLAVAERALIDQEEVVLGALILANDDRELATIRQHVDALLAVRCNHSLFIDTDLLER
jgi:hypothetical protein